MSDLLPQGNGGASNRSSVLDQLNPNDIERIEVISGPAASTLYGTDAAAGVIQVFTRRGSNRAPVWTAEVQEGTMWNQKFGANGIDYIHMDPWICTAPFKCGEFQHTPLQQLYSLSVRGGAQALQYFVSGGYEDELGGTPEDALERWNVRGNFTITPVEDLVIQWNTAYSNTWQQNGATGNYASGLTLNVYRQEQNYFGTADKNIINTALDWENNRTIERVTTGGTFTYSPIANLTQRLTIGYDFTQQEARAVQPFGFIPAPQGTINVNTYSRRFLTFDYVGTYTFNFGEALRSSFSWGGQATGDASAEVEASGEGFPGAAIPTVNSASSTLGEETRQKVWNSGFFFQNVFDLQNKYFLTLGLRVDGNSTFGKNFNLQMYPKASASWVLSDESFWNPNFGEMKLRAAFGKSGRAPGALVARRTWTNTGLEGEPAFTPSNLGNPDIGPEVTSELELGVDASWFNARVRPAFTFYHQTTDDALQSIAPIPSLGFTSSVNFNIGKVENQGYELRLDFTPVETANFGWDLATTFSKNKNNVLEWESNADDPRVGRPISYRTWTMYQNPEGMGSTRRTEGVYAAQSCMIEQDDPNTPQVDSVPRPGLDPTFHTCTYSSVNDFGYIQSRPTTLATLNTTVRLPAGISISARSDYTGGGAWQTRNAMGSAVGRNVRSPVCIPYYVQETGVVLRADTPAIWAHRCTPALNQAYDVDVEEFRIQSISATFPMDFAFPDRIQNAVLTLVMNNPKVFHHHWWGMGGLSERLPVPTSLRASLRVTF
jgi:outer membrane receptor protein involved in Fe transport